MNIQILKKIIILTCICSVLVGCTSKGKEEDNHNNFVPEVFGAELQNIECTVYKDGGEKPVNFYFVSKINIPNNSGIDLEYKGGNFEYSYTIEMGESSIEDYSTYVISFDLKNFVFEAEKITIDKIKINYEQGKSLEIVPQKFIINYVEGDYNNDDLLFYGSPLSIPYEMKEFPFELGSKQELTLKKVLISNTSLKYQNESENNNKVITSNNTNISLRFSSSDDILSKYTQYLTSIVFFYEVNGKEYVRMTPSVSITYNSLFNYKDNFKLYYEEVLRE